MKKPVMIVAIFCSFAAFLTTSCSKTEPERDTSMDGTKWATKVEDYYYFKTCDVLEFFNGEVSSYDADENYHMTSSANEVGTGTYTKDGNTITFHNFIETHNGNYSNYTITFLTAELSGTIMKVQYEYANADTTRINNRTYSKI
jgi:hypothetical protein